MKHRAKRMTIHKVRGTRRPWRACCGLCGWKDRAFRWEGARDLLALHWGLVHRVRR